MVREDEMRRETLGGGEEMLQLNTSETFDSRTILYTDGRAPLEMKDSLPKCHHPSRLSAFCSAFLDVEDII